MRTGASHVDNEGLESLVHDIEQKDGEQIVDQLRELALLHLRSAIWFCIRRRTWTLALTMIEKKKSLNNRSSFSCFL
eukprot:SAG11_NODE_25983_length_351_cov_0.821429_1_plen_76_part_01